MVQRTSERISEMTAVAGLSRSALIPVTDGNTSYKVPLPRLSRVFNVLNYLATGDGVTDDSVAFLNADAAAALVGGIVYVPAGSYNVPSFALSSGVTLEGDGDQSILLNCHFTCTGTMANALAFTAPAAKGAFSVSIPATGLTGAWLRLASCINCNSTDAGIDQLGDRPTDASFFAEFAQIKTGSAGSAALYRGLEFAYSNTPGGDSGSFTTSTARVVTFHTGARVKRIKFLGRPAAATEIVKLTLCKGTVFEDVTFDTNDGSCYAITGEYCLDCRVVGGSVTGKRTAIASASENVVLWKSSTNCYADGVDGFGGYQTYDVTYMVQDATYRGGPSIDCGAKRCTADGYQVDGFCSHNGCVRTFFDDCQARGGTTAAVNGFRIRGRGDRVRSGVALGRGSTGAGVKVHEFALFDCDVAYVDVRGFSNNIELDYAATTMAAARALLGGSRATVRSNKLSDAATNGIALLDSPALATMIGPRIDDNDIYNTGGDGIDVGAYVNGTVLGTNRMYGIPSGGRGVRYTTNTKRLNIGTQFIYGVNASGFAIGGASVVNQMTDATTFPSGNAEAQLFIDKQYTDAATPYTGIRRGDAAYLKATTPGNGADASIPVVLTVSGSPNNVVYAPIGSICTDLITGIPYSKTSGADAATGWVKASAT